MGIYEFAILGNTTSEQRENLTKSIEEMASEFGLCVDDHVRIYDSETVMERNRSAAFTAIYFGGSPQVDIEAAQSIYDESVPIVPVVSRLELFSVHIPDFLQPTNGYCLNEQDPEMKELAALMMECVGLLRRQRRVFVSYRRTESRDVALQMYDVLTEKGFDVFLDTHDIRPGETFQDALWHKLCDSDVLIMLDTPTYFESRWTREEIGRARAKEIHVLRVVWPNHIPNKMTDLSETIYLNNEDLENDSGPLTNKIIDEIALKIETIRSRSIAARYMSITGRLRAEVERIGASFEGVGAHRAIAIRLIDDRKLWLYPVVGIPTAETLNDIAMKAHSNTSTEAPVLVYDDLGIRKAWSDHLQWLDQNIKAVRGLKVTNAGWELAGWEE
ncbi:toll/interleukin-1 receptor domain-containing protein [Vibrio cyclitrophicus]|uniref:toll/interleukin-1 receptor domain-containing protein n=1 Tax=Vibrio TaxID=662 RepID=UPI00029A95F0|nr:toll/interleukin-1 receptor domain-containing protein [Vibrio cyclitrophicus]OBT14423.1 molecular chaperone Tir [Vibrio cyclitrophicus]OEE27305.1 molecular chaperone Tir [Vibrio cyclitrophicus ZF170]OEE28147.1 molecular chaperone Tir [Vibrio cyclitrophicus ZF14]PMF61139.1 molecular chaperone Tir [Vibrio cyclitrophicus]